MTKTVAKPAYPAKRGDLVLITRTSSSTFCNGPTVRETIYCLAIVTSITRDGDIKSAERPSSLPWPWKFTIGTDRRLVVSADRFSVSASEVLAASCGDYPSLDAARDALRPFLKPLTGR